MFKGEFTLKKAGNFLAATGPLSFESKVIYRFLSQFIAVCEGVES